MRHDARTRAYVERRTHEGLAKPEIIRCSQALRCPRDLPHTQSGDANKKARTTTCHTIGASTRKSNSGGYGKSRGRWEQLTFRMTRPLKRPMRVALTDA
jgi:hypothetical protein